MNFMRCFKDPDFYEKSGYALAIGVSCLILQLYSLFLITRTL